ncbi:Genetic interactor of prohibitins 3 mitochondrial protein [Rutstroemia sp. NJR-2017a BVV2]|nr:Genetic interactor of prohibitins 3 mitochondrial protein [Rutstroemia sp. NJR-2017a BVV2]
MSLSTPGRHALRLVKKQAERSFSETPIFLLPQLARHLQQARPTFPPPQKHSRTQRRYIQTPTQEETKAGHVTNLAALSKLPSHCPGCGALAQADTKDVAGYYTMTRRSVKQYLGARPLTLDNSEDEIVRKALEKVDSSILDTLGIEQPAPTSTSQEPPVCDRCHNLKHHETGVSIHHPSMEAIKQTIHASPYKYNYVYHVIDAADFPMSFIPDLVKALQFAPLRSQNRRSRLDRYYAGRSTAVNFVITRGDLLAPLKEQVDSMMPYLREILREAMGSSGRNVRLGDVTCVSAVRGWWTPMVKRSIYTRAGGNWLVGKFNVGKSQLFNSVFPKGKGVTLISGESLPAEEHTPAAEHMAAEEHMLAEEKVETTDEFSLLPPAQKEVAYPVMPLVSPLPGTTASPIRVPFRKGRGELIDLPGLARSDLELHVQPEHRSSLFMRSRVTPEQQVIKPGQSLLLGGFLRFTPTNPDTVVLAYAFTPLKPHLTSNEKAVGIQTRTRESTVENISAPGTEERITSAGVFSLKWDVTKQRTGSLTSRKGVVVDELPYKVLSVDIVIEGCGWVELVAQVSKRNLEQQLGMKDVGFQLAQEDETSSWPFVEVFTPEGKFVAARRPMNAWIHCAPRPSTTKGRPRKSMKSAKKQMKRAMR